MANRTTPPTVRISAVRYLVVGGLSLCVDYTVYVLVYRGTSVGAALAAAAGYLAAFVVNFGLNRTWVFDVASGHLSRQLRRYLVLVAVNLAITAAAVGVLVASGVDYRIAKLAVAAVIAIANFLIMRLWVFRPPEPSRRGPSTPEGRRPE